MKDLSSKRNIKDEILDATDRLLSRRGYRKMTIDELARDVGIGKGSVYLHFSSKEEIALSHVDRIIEKLITKLYLIAERKTSCETRLREMLLERVLFRFDSVQHYSQSLNELLAHLRPSLLERRERYFDREARVFEMVINEGIEIGLIAKTNSESIARSFLLTTNSLLPYSLSARELGDRDEVQTKTERIIDLLLFGAFNR